jgi:3',5'-cyclic AMP phosphodiesterase CpdA
MRIIQITDLHIYPEDKIINGVDTRRNFLKVLEKVAAIHHDMLVLTGDLSFVDGDSEVYKWIKEKLDNFKLKDYYVIGGNHDVAEKLAEVFDLTQFLKDNELYYFIEPNFIFLDTVKGYCSEKQLNWLETTITSIENEKPVIFMHHPPYKSGVPHMDNKYAFEQPGLFTEICNKNTNTTFVFCGHYHNEISLMKNNVNVFITPSTYLQIYMLKEDFEVDHRIPAFRIIDIDNKLIKTTVRYVYD